jgi:aldose 1-epimerase
MNPIRAAGSRTPFDAIAGKVCVAILGLATSLAALPVATRAADHSITKTSFGRVEGREIELYTLTNRNGIEARIMTYGAAIVSLRTLAPYLAGVPYFGATVGRYANRIAGGRFVLDGKTYELAHNDGPNSLHGGTRGFDKRIWHAQVLQSATAVALRLTYFSAAGEEGYPGELTAHVTYRLQDDDRLAIDYEATTSAPTPINLANHAYFNLSGDPHRSILDHVLTIRASRFTPVGARLIPTGELRPVDKTSFDFRTPHAIGSRIESQDEQLRLGRGYDHNWVLDKPLPGAMAVAALLSDAVSGRTLQIETTQPGLQFYSGNFLDGKPAGHGTVFGFRTGLCLETQHFPDSPNHPGFASTVLHPGETYSEHTVLAFGSQPR